jgi:hypothetical protein
LDPQTTYFTVLLRNMDGCLRATTTGTAAKGHARMKKNMSKRHWALAFALVFATTPLAWAGSPFLTDDPETVPYHHKEFYIFSTLDEAPDRKTIQAPAFEFNFGVVPDLQLHLEAPYTSVYPERGSAEQGIGDTEVGIKYRFVDEVGNRPQVGIFPAAELPTGDADRGLGNGRLWWRLPLWVQKSWGAWTSYGGGGYAVNHAPGMRDYWFGVWLLQRQLNEHLTLGGEVFAQQADVEDGKSSTLLNFGGTYDIRTCGCSLLFSGGHSVAGEVHTVAYVGLYWTWGPAEEK